MRRHQLLTALALTASLAMIASPAATHVPLAGGALVNVPYYPMHSAICAVKSLQMVLSYYGHNYSESLLLQLSGWDYGAYYLPSYHFGYGIGSYPVEAVARAAKLLGFSVRYVDTSNFSRALEVVVKALRNSTPVIIQLSHHTIVAVGYEGGDVLVNDPSGGPYSWSVLEDLRAVNLSASLGRQSQSLLRYLAEISVRKGFGSRVPLTPKELREEWRSWWGTYQALIIKPVKPVEALNLSTWAEVLRHDGELELGTTATRGWGCEGVKAWELLAKDLRTYFPSVVRDEPAELYWVKSAMLDIAASRRLDASAFLAGLASALRSRNLTLASWWLERASDEFSYASTLIDEAIAHRSNATLAKELLLRASNHVLRGGEYDRLAGEYMIKAAEQLSRLSTPAGRAVKAGASVAVPTAAACAVAAAAAASVATYLIVRRSRRGG